MKDHSFPIAIEGLPFIFFFLAAALLLLYFSRFGKDYSIFFSTFGWFLLFLALFSISFFRNPERLIPDDLNAVVSPSDGTVVAVEKVNNDRYLKKEALKISIFMSVFNVHVNRAPVSGKVEKILYNKGKFISANLDKASFDNEQNGVVVEAKSGEKVAFVQIAGLIARRIVCYLKEGDEVIKGERIGLIRFGSRLDVYLPLTSKINVKVGGKVKAGESVIAYME